MNGENRPLVPDELVEFEQQPVRVQDLGINTYQFRGIYEGYLKLINRNRNSTTCNQLDLEILGSCPIMPKITESEEIVESGENTYVVFNMKGSNSVSAIILMAPPIPWENHHQWRTKGTGIHKVIPYSTNFRSRGLKRKTNKTKQTKGSIESLDGAKSAIF